MKLLRTIAIGLMLLCFLLLPALSQQTSDSARQTSQTSASDEKPRTSSETRKQLESLACGPPNVHFSHDTAKQPEPLPSQPADKALIFVLRSRSPSGAALQARLGVDSKWVGVNRPGNYFYFELEPGPHYFCVEAVKMERGVLSLIVEKGKTYFLQQEITMTGTELEILDHDKGEHLVAK